MSAPRRAESGRMIPQEVEAKQWDEQDRQSNWKRAFDAARRQMIKIFTEKIAKTNAAPNVHACVRKALGDRQIAKTTLFFRSNNIGYQWGHHQEKRTLARKALPLNKTINFQHSEESLRKELCSLECDLIFTTSAFTALVKFLIRSPKGHLVLRHKNENAAIEACKAIAKALHRPLSLLAYKKYPTFAQLMGNHYTEDNASFGDIAKSLIQGRCMNPVIYLGSDLSFRKKKARRVGRCFKEDFGLP